MFQRILVVCTGNICRSPMAEVLLHAQLKGRIGEVSSAGTGALVGRPAEALACELMRDRGLDLSTHRARQATLPLLSSMDLILALDQTHADWIARHYPELRGRVHKLLKWQRDRDVADPYQLARPAFEQALADIETGIADWLKRL